ncbi:MAG: DUF1810 domain-containing protein [Ginsengibacter sp.]
MDSGHNLQRFIDAQENVYSDALEEIKRGRKQSHWMWFVFPQIQGLGFSPTSKLYAIKDIREAKIFLHHPLLGHRLMEISNELLQLESNNAHAILGSPDDMKLQSSMTLFSSVHDANPVFNSVLKKFFNGIKDMNTLRCL